jgi:hypothetical protein
MAIIATIKWFYGFLTWAFLSHSIVCQCFIVVIFNVVNDVLKWFILDLRIKSSFVDTDVKSRSNLHKICEHKLIVGTNVKNGNTVPIK